MEVKLGGCRGATVGSGSEPNCAALLCDEIYTRWFLQKPNYKREDRIQWTALTMQLPSTWRLKKAVSIATVERACSIGNGIERK